MSAERVARLEKANGKRQREQDDVIEGKRTRLRCKNARAEVQQMVELDTQDQENANATFTAEAPEKVKSCSSESAPANIAYKDKPVLLKTIKPFPTETENKRIAGVATIGDKTFIVCLNCSYIFIYTGATLNFFRKFKLRSLESAFDMVSCPRNECLYIMDLKINKTVREILKVDPNGKVISRLSTGRSWGALSMTHESNLLLTDKVDGNLKEFSAEGKLMLEVALPEDIVMYHLSHAVKLTNGHFVVCHGAHADLLHRVCLLDNKGVVLKSIGEDPNTLKLNYPFCLAVDSDDSILVADNDNFRVLLLNSDLEFKRELLTEKDGLRHPWISLDEVNRRLFVVDEGWSGTVCDCRLLVFDV